MDRPFPRSSEGPSCLPVLPAPVQILGLWGAHPGVEPGGRNGHSQNPQGPTSQALPAPHRSLPFRPCVLQPRPPCSPAETSPPPWSPPNLSLPFPLGPQASLLTVPGSGSGTACGQACDMSWIFRLGWTFRLETSQSHCLSGRESVCPRLPGAGCGGSGSRAGGTQKRQLY